MARSRRVRALVTGSPCGRQGRIGSAESEWDRVNLRLAMLESSEREAQAEVERLRGEAAAGWQRAQAREGEVEALRRQLVDGRAQLLEAEGLSRELVEAKMEEVPTLFSWRARQPLAGGRPWADGHGGGVHPNQC